MVYMVTFTINIHQYTPNVTIYTIHGSYGKVSKGYIFGILVFTLSQNGSDPLMAAQWGGVACPYWCRVGWLVAMKDTPGEFLY